MLLLITDESDENFLGKSIKEELITSIQKSEIEYKLFRIKDKDIRSCLGCFSCWIKTDGECVIGDIGKQISDFYTQSENVIILSPIKYGCYSTVIKNILDRITPNNLPFLTRYRNRTRHKARYDRYPHLIIIGYGEDISEAEEQTFVSLADANAVNFQKDSAKAYICKCQDDIESIFNKIFDFLVQ